MRLFPLLCCCAIILYGCEAGGIRPDNTAEDPDAGAFALFHQGNYRRAADEFMRLAELYPENSTAYRLQAAAALIENGDTGRAEAILGSLPVVETDKSLQLHKSVLQARIALDRGRAGRALELLQISVPENTRPALFEAFHLTRARAFTQHNNYLAAAGELIRLAARPSSSGARPENIRQIWRYLTGLDPDELVKAQDSTSRQEIPWLELAVIVKSYLASPERLTAALDDWKAAYPGHPAGLLILPEITAISARLAVRPQQIALLLPLNGGFEKYAERIRDGFLSAWFHEEQYKPEIRIYDAGSLNFIEVYRQAVADGAEFIVGPLEKQAVRQLLEMESPPVRTLALNQVDSPGMTVGSGQFPEPVPDLVQFGLPPEDEAIQVARRGILEGYNRVLIITSSDNYGSRVAGTFTEEWQQSGGQILKIVRYDPETNDFISPVKRLLNIDSSELRINKLRQRLSRNLISTGRLREDAELIFMVADSPAARQIAPQLRFLRAETIPIYTISHVYTGRPNPQADKDLNGIEFVDIPWLLRHGHEQSGLYRQVRKSWGTASTVFPRYYAFGIDAFHLLPRLTALALDPKHRYSGETGSLYMTAGGIIRRDLAWARFVEGVPRAFEPEVLR